MRANPSHPGRGLTNSVRSEGSVSGYSLKTNLVPLPSGRFKPGNPM
jgi:hypothetical protein